MSSCLAWAWAIGSDAMAQSSSMSVSRDAGVGCVISGIREMMPRERMSRSTPLPAKDGYEQLHAVLVPPCAAGIVADPVLARARAGVLSPCRRAIHPEPEGEHVFLLDGVSAQPQRALLRKLHLVE